MPLPMVPGLVQGRNSMDLLSFNTKFFFSYMSYSEPEERNSLFPKVLGKSAVVFLHLSQIFVLSDYQKFRFSYLASLQNFRDGHVYFVPDLC
jgi:hypothetical protein